METNTTSHETVLLDEAVESLLGDLDGCYVVGTFGRGGHTRKILNMLSPSGRVIAFDKDPQAIENAQGEFGQEDRLKVIHGAFSNLRSEMSRAGQLGHIAGILLDLGVSSPQLNQAQRGFSFLHDGPLDMRMDPTSGMSAAEWIATEKQNEIARVLKVYGEERFAKRMAAAIVSARQESPITSTRQLAEIIKAANPAWEKGKNPATRAFQAIRIYVNNELGELERVLNDSLDVLKPGGRLVVISFHSLEDRMVKQFIRKQAKGDELPASIPIRDDQLNKRLKPIGKSLRAGVDEVARNPRSRSAMMRVAEKL